MLIIDIALLIFAVALLFIAASSFVESLRIMRSDRDARKMRLMRVVYVDRKGAM